MNIKKLIAGFLCATLGLSLCGCGGNVESAVSVSESVSVSENSEPTVVSEYKTVSLSDDGTLEINRKELGSTPMGEDGTWTIFVYMSGSNLESSGGNATDDLKEMLAASTGKKVKFIIQTGGCYSWKNDIVSSEKLQRYEISDGKRKKLSELTLSSMAETSTLSDFLEWGIKNYPAAKMGVVFWGHGKGSIGGVCKDDLFGNSYLSLESINSALSKVAASMTDKFEFLGFDNCYMGTVEMADIAATYARYMIGSGELEPAGGWNYTVLGNLLGEKPNADWNEIAKTLCDGFVADSDGSDFEHQVTISVINLSKLDDVLIKFDDFASELVNTLKDKSALAEFENNLVRSEHYGTKNGFNGYSNNLDFGELVQAGSKFSDKANTVIDALNSAVIYKHSAEEHKNSLGLTIYYPMELQGISELRTFGKVSVSPNYLALTDQKLRSKSPVADTTNYDKKTISELWCDYRNNGSDALLNYWSTEPDNGYNKIGESALVKLTKEPTFANGQYSVSLDPQTLNNIASVGLELYQSVTEHKFRCYGLMPCSNADWETGTFSGQFDGKWILLPNKDPLEIKPYKNGGDNSYITQVKLRDGVYQNDAVMTLTFENDNPQITTVWETVDGVTTIERPQAGRSITALYDLCGRNGDKFSTDKGSEYELTIAPRLLYDKLSDGTYFYMVVITDIYGDRYHTNPVDFTVKNGQLDYSTSQ